jgi:hypothetical protein
MSLTVTHLLLLIMITIHYHWINIITTDQPSKMSLSVVRLFKDVTDNDVFAPRHCDVSPFVNFKIYFYYYY